MRDECWMTLPCNGRWFLSFRCGTVIFIILCLRVGGGCRRCGWVSGVGLVEAAVGLMLSGGFCSGVALLLGFPSEKLLRPAGALVDVVV